MLRVHRHIAILMLLLSTSLLKAGGEITPRGARSAGLGNSSVMLQGIWAAYNNQAGLVGIEGIEAGVYFHNLFGVGSLNDQGIAVAYGDENRAFAVNMSSFGVDVFKEDRYGLAYGMRLGEKMDIGVQLNYHSTRILSSEYGSRSSLTAEIGLMSHLTEEFTLAFRLFNPSQTQLSEYEDERIPTVMSIGGSYDFNEKVSLVSEVTKDIDTQAIVRAGIEYRVVPTVYLRGGVSTEPTLSSFGAGVELGQLDIDLAASYHNTLGYSTQISLCYSFSDNAQ